MIGAVLDLVIGPLGAIIAAFVTAGAVFFAGKKSADYDAEKAYRKSRKEIDDADLGLGATDDERIKRLRDIAAGR